MNDGSNNPNYKCRFMFALMVLMLFWSVSSEAGSIWAKRDKNMKDLYADDVARKIGDILTITITEASKVENKVKRDLKKDTKRSTTFDGDVGDIASLPDLGMAAESNNELKSKADFKDERSFIDSVTVVVVDIMPNGNLVVMGSRNRDIGGDIQIIEVSGIVRPNDIAFNNTIASKQVANFNIVSRNKGVSAPFTRPGWLGRIFDILWPF